MKNKWLVPAIQRANASNGAASGSGRHNHTSGAGSDFCEYCGRAFSTYTHLVQHQRSCKPAKQDVSSLLEETKKFWESRKRRKVIIGSVPESYQAPQGAPPAATVPRARRRAAGMTIGIRDMAPRGNMDLSLPVALRKGKRGQRQPEPLRFTEHDILPEPLPAIPEETSQDSVDMDVDVAENEVGPSGRRSESESTRTLFDDTSKRNTFGVLKAYRLPVGTKLTHDPDQAMTSIDLTDTVVVQRRRARPYGPFASRTAFDLADWYWGSTQKSLSDFEDLIYIIGNPTFSIPDATKVNWKAAFKALGANREDIPAEQGDWIEDDGWKSTPVFIDVPFHKKQRDWGVRQYFAGNFRHRSILSVIKEKIANAEDSRLFHYQPYQATWKAGPCAPEVELYGELYYSRAFREANEEVQYLPCTKLNDGLERVVVSLMFWSDATKLTSFGGSTLWPCYMFFGNESKYRRCQPSELLGRHIAYFIKLAATFKEYLKERNGGKIPTDALMAHCTRELFQSQWSILLDEELIEAMKHGIVLLCPDGVYRCFFPRIFTYSADYPEKVLIASVRNNGGCPCHRCTIKKSDLSNLGAPTDTERRDQMRSEQEQKTKVDQARAVIAAGYAVDTDQVEALLKPLSLVPTETSMTRRLSDLNFELLPTLVVDLLHEFEIGAWKNLFIHLMRLLDAFSQQVTLTAELDSRYRATPAFGRDTIRKFGTNASEMKRKAARDYEDLLQCAIPAFEGLLPEPHNTHLMRLLYICAQWHALAKLRVHHDLTLDLLDYTTVRLGAQMRLFNNVTCESKVTRELQKEADARARREGNGKAKSTTARKPVKFGVFTIKFHVLGDYSTVIRRYGTSDSYSTETGELWHRMPKSWFERTDKRQYEVQLSEIERRKARLASIRAKMQQSAPDVPESRIPEPMTERLEHSRDSRYVIGITQKCPIDLHHFAQNPHIQYADPYVQDTVPKLKQHLLPRILSRLGFNSPEAVGQCDWTDVVLQESRLFSHRLLRINYTTYDVRREQDVIHIDTPQCNVMLLSSDSLADSEHPYIYARILGIFHAHVSYVNQLPDGTFCYTPHRIDFCWVHWYTFNRANEEFGLERASPLPLHSPDALGFLDPGDILRAAHLVPQFSLKKFDRKVPAKRAWDNKQELWNVYFLNRFADRDLFMRYQYGMSIGHAYMYLNKNFPQLAPTPSIPPDFDYHMTRATTASNSNAFGAGGPPPPSQTPQTATASSGQESLHKPTSEVLGSMASGNMASGVPGGEQDASLLAQGDEERLEGETEDDDDAEVNSYDDELDDDELIAYDDMYGLRPED